MSLLSVLTIASADCASRVSLSEPLAVASDAKSVAVAVLMSGSSARLDANATGAVNTSESPAPVPSTAPVAANVVSPALPETEPQSAMPLTAHCTTPVSVTPTGSESLMLTLAAPEVPVLRTVTT